MNSDEETEADTQLQLQEFFHPLKPGWTCTFSKLVLIFLFFLICDSITIYLLFKLFFLWNQNPAAKNKQHKILNLLLIMSIVIDSASVWLFRYGKYAKASILRTSTQLYYIIKYMLQYIYQLIAIFSFVLYTIIFVVYMVYKYSKWTNKKYWWIRYISYSLILSLLLGNFVTKIGLLMFVSILQFISF